MSASPELPRLKAAEKRLAEAVAPFVPDLGLNRMSVRAGAKSAGFNQAELDLIAPNGAADVAALLWRGCDEGALGPDAETVTADMKIRDRIGYLLNAWLDAFVANKALAHRLIGCLMLPSASRALSPPAVGHGRPHLDSGRRQGPGRKSLFETRHRLRYIGHGADDTADARPRGSTRTDHAQYRRRDEIRKVQSPGSVQARRGCSEVRRDLGPAAVRP